MANTNAPVTAHIPGVINPYENVEIFHHKKFISHIGIAFADLKTVDRSGTFRKAARTVLRKICGQINYGTLNVIRGPRRSGKTTLLKSLAGRNNEHIDPESNFYVNEDLPPDAVYMDRDIGTNILLALTVEELLEFSFRLRNIGAAPAERVKTIRETIKTFELKEIEELQLNHCTNEERFRAQMAMIMCTVQKPNLIFFDEPLQDLDAIGIENTVTLLKRITREYRIGITFAVGQILDSDILAIFDKLYVLSRGGLCIYEGSVEHLSLYLREANVSITSQIQTPMERLIKVASKPNQTTLFLANLMGATKNDVVHMSEKYGVLAPNGIMTPKPRVTVMSIALLFERGSVNVYRTYWKTILIHLLLICAGTVALTTAFDDDIGQPNGCFNQTSNRSHSFGRFSLLGRNRILMDESMVQMMKDNKIDVIEGQNLIDENVKFMFVITAALSLIQLVTSLDRINDEVKVVINEHRNGWVNINSYMIVKNLIELVVPMVNTTVGVLLAYFLTGQVGELWRFALFLYAQIIGVICAQSIGFVVGIISVFNNRYTSLMVVTFYLVIFVFSGYLIPMDEAQPWIRGLSFTSFMKLSYELTLLSLYGLNRCSNLGFTNSYVLDEFGIEYDRSYWRNSVVMLAHLVVYRFVFWTITVSKVNKKSTIDRPDMMISEHDIEQMEGLDAKNK